MRWSLLLAGMALMLPVRVAAEPEKCSIRSTSDRQTEAVMEGRGFDFEGYDRLCRFLRDRNLRVDISGSSGVLSGRSYAWATIQLADRATDVRSTGSTSSTVLNTEASSPTAEAALRGAINNAMTRLATNQRALADLTESVATEIVRLRRVLGTPPTSGAGK